MKTEAGLSRIIYRKGKSFFSFVKAPRSGTRCLFFAKIVKNSKISHFKRFFVVNPQNLRLFTNNGTRNKPWLFFTIMKPRQRHKQQPLIDCLSKRDSNRFYANLKNAGRYVSPLYKGDTEAESKKTRRTLSESNKRIAE